MSKPIGVHEDGSNCYTKSCRRSMSTLSRQLNDAVVNKDFNKFIDGKNNIVKTRNTVTTGIKHTKKLSEEKEFSSLLSKAKRNMQHEEWDSVYAAKTEKLLQKLYHEYGLPDTGRTRAVYHLGNGEVVKVAFNSEGEYSNNCEVQASLDDDPLVPVASSRFDKMDDVEVIIMDEVEPVTAMKYADLPPWVALVDCGQVGYDSRGRLVAYDL